jgi:D-glycero-beta-D-manno-heptose 1-phosphate adenylyltransferase
VSSLEEAAAFCAAAKRRGQTVALCNGAFDLLHVGHLRYLQGAKAIADVVMVAVNSDDSVRRSKGPARPVIPEHERLELVQALRAVDHAFLFSTDTVEPVLRALLPTFHCKGTDYTEANVPEAALSSTLGVVTRIVGDPKDHSTTALAKKLGR